MDSNARNAAILTRAAELAVTANSLHPSIAALLGDTFATFTPETYLELATSEIDALLSTPEPDGYAETDSMRSLAELAQRMYDSGTDAEFSAIRKSYKETRAPYLGSYGGIKVYRNAPVAERAMERQDIVGTWCNGCQTIHVLVAE